MNHAQQLPASPLFQQPARVCLDSSRIYHAGGEIDHCFKAGVSFVCSHSDPLEFLELAEEVFDEIPPFVEIAVERKGLGSSWMLGDDDLGAPRIEISDIASLSKALPAIRPPKSTPSRNAGMPIVSKRCPGIRRKRTRLPSASVSARILVVIPPLERPMAWLCVPPLVQIIQSDQRQRVE